MKLWAVYWHRIFIGLVRAVDADGAIRAAQAKEPGMAGDGWTAEEIADPPPSEG